MHRVLPRAGILTFVAIMLVFALTVWAQAIEAQESTDTPAPVETVEMTPVPEAPPVVVVETPRSPVSFESILLFIGAIIAGIFWISDRSNKRVQSSVPVEVLLRVLEVFAGMTPTKTDDELIAMLKKLIEPSAPEPPAVG